MRFRYSTTKLRFVERPPRQEEWRAIHRAAERRVRDVELAFQAALGKLRRATSSAPIRAALERGATEIAVSVFPWAILERALEDKLLPILGEVANRGAVVTIEDLERQFRRRFEVRKARGGVDAEIGLAFDLVNPAVVTELAAHGADLVTLLTNETRAAVNEIVLGAQQNGLDVRGQASRIAAVLRQTVGLNAPQARALLNYEIALTEAGRSSIDIASLLAQRRERMIEQRSRVIARHETLNAANIGQQDVWRQATEQGLLPAGQKRKWLTQGSLNPSNPCPICAPMNGQIRGLNEVFVSPYDGRERLYPPAHVSCECVTVLQVEDT